MKAILIARPGGPEVLEFGEATEPTPAANEVLIDIEATALNRADTLQRRGKYPPPPGASPILGLEMAGKIIALGEGASRWKVGDRVCGLLSGGGYATRVCLHEDMALPIPDGMSMVEAAALPEVYLTAFQALHWITRLQKGERLLIHAAASGVGTAAIQLAKAIGAEVLGTASAGKHQLCLQLGASHIIDYKQQDFVKEVLELTNGEGVDVVVDFIGGPYFNRNLEVLRSDGRLVQLAIMGGAKVDTVNLLTIQRKRLQITGSTLRARSLDYKLALNRAFADTCWPLFETGQLRPVIDSIYPWKEVIAAHRLMESNGNQGKIVLKVEEG